MQRKFLRKKTLSLRSSAPRAAQEIEKQYPYILLFHCSGSTSRQWQKIKNILCTIKGKTLFKPKDKKKRKNILPNNRGGGHWIAQLASSAGPTCILYLTKKAPNDTWSQLLLPASYSQNLVLLYGQDGSTVFNHMDMEKATASETTSVFQQLLGFMLSPGACFLFLVEQANGRK
uniref:Ribosomal protein L10 n=1 Tax=Pallavicinia lyellii TaxID=56939 RepID=A0A4Y5WSK4_PALLY|nr:ribosomal protein L10 [Moerckia flotoviana]QDE10625.1 ribosomal protein L10 [Pallavicinia lyellii]WIA66612.1 ribosomal protein L10 [Moerckia flotoviana]